MLVARRTRVSSGSSNERVVFGFGVFCSCYSFSFGFLGCGFGS